MALSGCSAATRTETAEARPRQDRSASGAGLTSNGYGHTDADFVRVGLRRDSVEVWEDGFRTAPDNGDPKVFEWWYADFTGRDGTVVSFTLNTRVNDGFVPAPGEAGRKPSASVVVTDPDGTSHGGAHTYGWDEFTASKERCDVRVGPFSMAGDLKTYRLRGQSGDVGVDLTLTSLVQPFRPGTGVLYVGDTNAYLGWLCVVPSGSVTGTVTVNGKQRAFTGHGYHDHNWGNEPFASFVEHWRWGRGSVGTYSVIGTDLHLRKEYDSAVVAAFLVDDTRTGTRLVGAFDPRTVTARESDPVPHADPAFPRDYYSKVHWSYRSGGDNADATFTDTGRLIVSRRYAADPTPAQHAALDRLGIDQVWYTRYATTNALTLDVGGTHASGTGAGTLEAAQFGLGNAPPKTTR
jgi:hypothetical protein